MPIRFLLLVAAIFFLTQKGRTQNDLRDPLGSAFRMSKQAELRKNLPPKSCLVAFSGGFRAFSSDKSFPLDFQCDPDFFYLTGYRLPDAVAVVFSEPQKLAEGEVTTLIFLPDKKDQGMASMGLEYNEKFGLKENGMAIRPATQWRKFCKEVLSTDAVERVFTKPMLESDFQKPGVMDYVGLNHEFYDALAPGFAFGASAQSFYKEILAGDPSLMDALAQRIVAYQTYHPDIHQDPILEKFVAAHDPANLRSLQEEIRRVKIDLLRMEAWMQAMTRLKTEGEVALLRKASLIASEAVRAAASRAVVGRTEAKLQAAAEFVIRYRGAIPSMPVRIASGKHSARPNYTANFSILSANGLVVIDLGCSMDGYMARATRTIPVGGTFVGDTRLLYEKVIAIHRTTLDGLQPGQTLSKINEQAATTFDEADKQLIFSTNAIGARKVLKITNLTPVGLNLVEGPPPGKLESGMVLLVETTIYLPDEEGVTPKWRGMGIVLRDMVRITSTGAEVLTGDLPSSVAGVEGLAKTTIKLPED